MLQLPNGCKCSEPAVSPSNWRKLKTLPCKNGKPVEWRITYRFYDPAYPKPKLCPVKNMNRYKTLEERRAATELILKELLHMLQVDGYNPYTNTCRPEMESPDHIPGTTPLVTALRLAYEKAGFEGRTKSDINGMLGFVESAAALLQYHYLPVQEVKKRHIRILLDKCGEVKLRTEVKVKTKTGFKVMGMGKWTPNTYNAYRKYLSVLFNLLVDDYEAIGANPVKNIKKKKVTKTIRKVLSPEECEKVDRFAYKYDKRLWMLIHMFYHSGARTTELFAVQGKHVNLAKQEVQYLVKKGRQPEWVIRPIKNIALPFWQMAMEGCGKNDYVLSKGLLPGPNAIRPDQITKRWKRHIKNKLGIDCGWYNLKHLNTTATIDLLEQMNEAQRTAIGQTGHKSEAMVVQIYDVKSTDRKMEQLKKINNPFGQTASK